MRGGVSTLLLFVNPERGRFAMSLPATKNPYPYADSIGPQVREERTRRRLSDSKLAKLADVSRRHLVELMKGANVTLNIAEKVMGALNLEELVFPGGKHRLRLPAESADAVLQREQLEEAAKQLEAGVALILRAVTAFRKAAPDATSKRVPAEVELATKARSLADDFGAYVNSLDSDEKVATLERLAASLLLSHTKTKKRRSKSA
jgi:transcriptional regulator with XRE-family HTH domain